MARKHVKNLSSLNLLTVVGVALVSMFSTGASSCSNDPGFVDMRVDRLKTLFANERYRFYDLKSAMDHENTSVTHNLNWEMVSDAYVNWSQALSALSAESRRLATQFSGLSTSLKNHYKEKTQEIEQDYKSLLVRAVNFAVPYEPWTAPIILADLSFTATDSPAGVIGRPRYIQTKLNSDYSQLYNYATPVTNWTVHPVEDSYPENLIPAIYRSWMAGQTGLCAENCPITPERRASLASHLGRYLRPTPPIFDFSEAPVSEFIFSKPNGALTAIEYGQAVAFKYMPSASSSVQSFFRARSIDQTASNWDVEYAPLSQPVAAEWKIMPAWDRLIEPYDLDGEDGAIQPTRFAVERRQPFALYNIITGKYLVDCPNSAPRLSWYGEQNFESTSLEELGNCSTQIR